MKSKRPTADHSGSVIAHTGQLGCYPLGLLQLLVQLLHGLAVFLPQLLDLSLVVPPLLLQGFLQGSHLLLTLRPESRIVGS